MSYDETPGQQAIRERAEEQAMDLPDGHPRKRVEIVRRELQWCEQEATYLRTQIEDGGQERLRRIQRGLDEISDLLADLQTEESGPLYERWDRWRFGKASAFAFGALCAVFAVVLIEEGPLSWLVVIAPAIVALGYESGLIPQYKWELKRRIYPLEDIPDKLFQTETDSDPEYKTE